MCVTVRTLCLLVSSVLVILSVARAVIHDMLHLMVHEGCDPFQIIPQSYKMVMMSVRHGIEDDAECRRKIDEQRKTCRGSCERSKHCGSAREPRRVTAAPVARVGERGTTSCLQGCF